jgi:DNA-binding NarL/FixJ family response regulator
MKETMNYGNSLPLFHCSLSEKLDHLKAFCDIFPAIVIVHDMVDAASVVFISKLVETIPGLSAEEIKGPRAAFANRLFDPEEEAHNRCKITNMLMRGDDDMVLTYFQQIKPSQVSEGKLFLTSTRIFHRTTEGKVSHLISTAIPIDMDHHVGAKVDRLVEENNFLRRNQHIFYSLSKREKEILKLMGKGFRVAEIADQLHIAETTASTHRRNIKSKLKAHSNYDIVFFAQAFNLL